MGFKEDLKIDKYSLDEEWIKQPSLFLEWAEKVVDAQTERDKTKDQLDLIKAELDAEIRADPKRFNLDKLTEAAVSNAIIQAEKFRAAQLVQFEKVRSVRVLEVAKEAFEHKKKALENLTQLYLSGYYLTDGARLKGDIKEQITKMKSEKMDDMLNKNPRLSRKRLE
jgi:hypothetical protein